MCIWGWGCLCVVCVCGVEGCGGGSLSICVPFIGPHGLLIDIKLVRLKDLSYTFIRVYVYIFHVREVWRSPSKYTRDARKYIWVLSYWNSGNKFRWSLNQNTILFIQGNASEYVICKMTAIWSQPQYCLTSIPTAHKTRPLSPVSLPLLCKLPNTESTVMSLGSMDATRIIF